MEKLTLIILIVFVLAAFNTTIEILLKFLDKEIGSFIYPILWINALAIFYAVLPDRVGFV
tara:strand:- start:330 stop:509 length:180 start_codon:yes stop_codon:yes gene_type:complete